MGGGAVIKVCACVTVRAVVISKRCVRVCISEGVFVRYMMSRC